MASRRAEGKGFIGSSGGMEDKRYSIANVRRMDETYFSKPRAIFEVGLLG